MPCRIRAYDYLLEVVSKDLAGYETFTRKLQRLENVKDIHTHLAIRQVKGNGSLRFMHKKDEIFR